MPTYVFACEKCPETQEMTCTISQYEGLRDTMMCRDCGTRMVRSYDPPSLMHVASPDGHGKKHDTGYQMMKEAAKLEVAKASMAPTKRGDIQKEINRLRAAKPGGPK